MTIANLITMLRILLVPVIIWALLSGATVFAFVAFLLAGLSDAVDGTVARMLDQQTELGTALDPVADKLMLVSVFVLLAWLDEIPLWLAILVLSRDVLIIAGFLLAFILGRAVEIRPLMVSKANTFAQIVLAAFVMGLLAFGLEMPIATTILVYTTAALTAASAIAYTVQGMRDLSASEPVGEKQVTRRPAA
ncbi:MAG: CDP-alcohol phosphatidyltransferase family protein [Ahrensia sp.]|nr:CDP-alcohol phosphatidyltransferase family protein [Ahrensia sp.]